MVASRYHINVSCRLDRMRRAAVNTIADVGTMHNTMVLVRPDGESYRPYAGPNAIICASNDCYGVGFVGITNCGTEVRLYYANRNGATAAQVAPITRPHGWPIVGEFRYVEPPVWWSTLYSKCKGGR